MKNKKIGIIISTIAIIGGLVGGISYKAYLQDETQDETEVQKKIEVQSQSTQEDEKATHEGTLKNQEINAKSTNGQTETTSKNNENSKINDKEELDNSKFESKIISYVSEFRKSNVDIPDFIKNLDSINTKNLNTDEKIQLDNVKQAAGDCSNLNSAYSQIKMAGDGSMEDIVKYGSEHSMNWAKEVIAQADIKNLIAMGVMSKEEAEKKISFLKEYVQKQQIELDKKA